MNMQNRGRVRENYNLGTLGMTGLIAVALNVFDIINNALDVIFFWGGLIFIITGYPIYFIISSARKNYLGDMIRQTLIVLLLAFVLGLVWGLPQLLVINHPELSRRTTVIRWGEIALVMFFLIRFFGKEHGKKRWLFSWLGHFGIVFLGLFIGRWVGILLISLPLLWAYYISLYNLAIITLPTSNPDDRKEKRKRFFILASYAWGIQSPIYATENNAWKKIDERIPGDFSWDFSDLPIPLLGKFDLRPGLVWARSHQAVAVSGGTTFKRVDGPGVFFVGKLERPDQVFDLRLQLRTNEIDVVSKDGVGFKVRVFTAFRMDNEEWTDETHEKVRAANSLLRGGRKLTQTKGSFPYSHLRVQAALSTTGTKAADNRSIVYWDQWALSIIEDHARKVISQKDLNELWRPAKDQKFSNALDIIANEIRENASLTLRSVGILLVVARVVNFHFPLNKENVDEISKQQLSTWASEWERKRSEILAKAHAKAEHAQQEARAYAEAVMLNSIAEGLQKTKEINPRLPPYVIAMRFLSTLQDHLHAQSSDGEDESEQTKKIKELHNAIMEWQEQFFPNSGKEK